MLVEILNLVVLLYLSVVVLGTWSTTGRVGRLIGAGTLLLVASFLLSGRLYTVERRRVIAVNRDRSEPLSFTVGDSIEFSREKREGMIDPYQLAVLRLADGG